jgi:hypothetical protein
VIFDNFGIPILVMPFWLKLAARVKQIAEARVEGKVKNVNGKLVIASKSSWFSQ